MSLGKMSKLELPKSECRRHALGLELCVNFLTIKIIIKTFRKLLQIKFLFLHITKANYKITVVAGIILVDTTEMEVEPC
jgi:hypothetical protein